MMEYLILFADVTEFIQQIGTTKVIILILTVAVLLVALWFSVKISNKNKLYLKPKKEEKLLNVVKENEVA